MSNQEPPTSAWVLMYRHRFHLHHKTLQLQYELKSPVYINTRCRVCPGKALRIHSYCWHDES